MTDMTPLNLAIIGSTGSVGSSVMNVCRSYPDKFNVVGLAAGESISKLEALAGEFRPEMAVLSKIPRDRLPSSSTDTKFFGGPEALIEMVRSGTVDHVVVASSGTDGIPALQEALKEGKTISLANKESILVAGKWVMASASQDQIRPLDSEHNAVWQCLAGEEPSSVLEVSLTASGGPFLKTPLKEMEFITPADAVAHPVWNMGRKISVDSATMINKGIEIIEAMRLFSLPHDKVRGYIHPGSSVHGAVRFVDGAVKMVMAPPDMRLAALNTLGYPKRLPLGPLGIEPLTMDGRDLVFFSPDRDRYPGYHLCLDIARMGGSYPTVLVGADEVAVDAFLQEAIPFTHIWQVIARVIDLYDGGEGSDLKDELQILDWARDKARSICFGR
ncbi:1-deoxy-D-xylulose 5-phosphate reductoisomerase [Dethiosulfovibrio peptidovorans DSM 11002]|uniref:1-deoxy-D-xylulose 5-phosphate reductoisomerase n=1 Tax=Dethiosulfovibrio peptidovorans DSM 11002 TaxID=469381 RepID=D2Z3F1_9BACT|nr:1-deoxy-D-xylulose-5-phosphate reductoisomerase [Dethiosulfovibrio peptidovorans]EFC92191.1 1-deoxy-D-xylulose 5-phosphate reductoisomerase [Dethiosulfovibrio peptidovorans DSM 11002]